jgi:Protein of unknown function (DUF2829)
MTDDNCLRVSGTASWYYDLEANAYSIKLDERGEPPYLHRITVNAILDIDSKGNLACIEIIDTPNGKEIRPPGNATLNLHNFGWAITQLSDAKFVRRNGWEDHNPDVQLVIGTCWQEDGLTTLKLVQLTDNSMFVIKEWTPTWEDLNATDWTSPLFSHKETD